MKKIIEGKMYNTQTADLICTQMLEYNGSWDGEKELYKTKKGQFFIVADYNYNNALNYYKKDGIHLISKSKAKEFIEKFGDSDDYINCFGEVEEG